MPPDDTAAIAAIYRPAVVDSPTSFELEPPDAAEMDRRVRDTLMRTPWIVCANDHTILGFAYAGRHRERPAYQWSVEVSAYVLPGHRRAGIGSALYASLFAILELQGFRNAYAGITLPNPASVGLHTRVGFIPVGVYRNVGYKLGSWHDVQWLERELAPHTPEPSAPTPLPALQPRDLESALASGVSRLRPPVT